MSSSHASAHFGCSSHVRSTADGFHDDEASAQRATLGVAVRMRKFTAVAVQAVPTN